MISSSFYLSFRSMKNRMLSSLLTVLSISLSVSLLLGVQKVREGAKVSFENTISDTDLIIGARTGPVQLLLYSVFHIGNASNNISYSSYQDISKNKEVVWTIPISLGDSHKGYRVVGTNRKIFSHFKYGRKKPLRFDTGKEFSDTFQVVLGAEVAKKLSYKIGANLILSHGVSDISFQHHDDKPFTVSGILQKTGTPVDRSLFISLEGLEAMHLDWQDGAPPLEEERISAEQVKGMQLSPQSITAFLVGLRSKIGIFRLQREINQFETEALTAILPGATFRELWQTVGIAENALLVVSFFVVIAGVLGMLASILSTLDERRREIAIIRSLGGKPRDIFFLLLSESITLASMGCLLGTIGIYACLYFAQPFIESQFNFFIPIHTLSAYDIYLIMTVLGISIVAGTIPAVKAYRQSLTDGLSIKV